MTRVEVVSPGALTTIQDLGRPGWAHIGVPRSGAADREALVRANRLVCNHPGAAGLETTLVGPKLQADAEADVVVALTGARVTASIGTREVPMDAPVVLPAGEVLSVGAARSGLRTYIALRGGVEAELTLGSAATDLLTGLGPAPLARGDVLRLGTPSPSSEVPATLALQDGHRPEGGPFQVALGPREECFTDAALRLLTTQAFTVSPASNRVGLRLEGPALARRNASELRSEGIVPGSIQVPPDGRPILLLADHPTTGGYPVIAVLREFERDRAAQLRPGERLGFTTVH